MECFGAVVGKGFPWAAVLANSTNGGGCARLLGGCARTRCFTVWVVRAKARSGTLLRHGGRREGAAKRGARPSLCRWLGGVERVDQVGRGRLSSDTPISPVLCLSCACLVLSLLLSCPLGCGRVHATWYAVPCTWPNVADVPLMTLPGTLYVTALV